MKVNLYAIYDRASGVYDGPFPGISDGAMIREFGDQVKNTDSKMGKHPDDFTLFRVGNWNDGTGELIDQVSEKLINGVEVLAVDDVNGDLN